MFRSTIYRNQLHSDIHKFNLKIENAKIIDQMDNYYKKQIIIHKQNNNLLMKNEKTLLDKLNSTNKIIDTIKNKNNNLENTINKLKNEYNNNIILIKK